MKKILLLSFLVMGSVCLTKAQTVIATQDFETVPATPTLSFTSTGTDSDGSATAPSGDVSHAANGTFGHIFNNGDLMLETGAIDVSMFINVNFSMRLASLSGTSGNGADGADEIIVEVSTDNGVTYSSELQVSGNNNARWGYTTGTGSASTAFDGNNSATVFTPAGGGGRTTDGYSTITVTNITPSSELRIRIISDNNASAEFWAIDDLTISGIPATSPAVGFDEASSTEMETDATFTTMIPVTLLNFGGNQVDLSVTVSGGTAEMTDYTLNTSSLSFTSSTTQNVSLDINDDADIDGETIELTIAETTSTGITLLNSVHTVTVVDDEIPNLVITEVMYNSTGSDDEWIEIYNGEGADLDVSGWTVNVGSGIEFTFPAATTITDGDFVTVALGTNGTGDFNEENPFTPDFNSGLSDANTLVNSTQIITLNTDTGTIIDEVTYDDGDDSRTDGTGPSYEIIDLDADNSLTASNWQASPVDGGSPGAFSGVTIWTGASSDVWNNANNWSNGIPGSTLNAIVESGDSPEVENDDLMTNDLTLNSGATLTIISPSGGVSALTINENLFNDGSIVIEESASLAIMGNRSGNGTASTNRDFPGNGALSMFGPSVGGEMISDLGADFVFFYDNSETNPFQVPTGEMFAGEGFFVGTNSPDYSISLEGPLNSGTVVIPSLEAAFEFLIFANPYAAPISISDFISNATNAATTTGTVYLWNDGGSNVGGSRGGDYLAVNNMGNTRVAASPDNGVDGPIDPNDLTGFIPSNFGFFAEIMTDGSVIFTPSMQSSIAFNGGLEDPFGGAVRNETEVVANRKTVKLSLSNGSLYNEIIVGLDDEASFGRDYGLDATKFSGNPAISFYSLQAQDEIAMAIQALPQVTDESLEVQLGFDLTEAGTYTINVEEIVNFGEDIIVYLNDTETGSIYNLSEVSSVSFNIIEPAVANGRFSLTFDQNRVTSIEDELLTASSLQLISGNSNGLDLAYDASTAFVKVFDLSGRVVFNEGVDFVGGVAHIATTLAANRVYVVQLDKEAIKFILK